MADSPAGGVEASAEFSPRWWDWMFGVVLPALALLFELFTRSCADLFVDPLPTRTAILGVAAVPGLWGAWLVRHREGLPTGVAHRLLLCGLVGFAGAYVLVLHQLFIVGVFALIFLGFGLLPLSPLGVLVLGLWRFRHWLHPVRGSALRLRSALAAALLGFGFGFGPFALESYVAVALNCAAEAKPGDGSFGRSLLRLATPESVAAVCEKPVHPLIAVGSPWLTAQTFFRTFGIPIQEAAKPTRTREDRGRFSFDSDDRWDEHLGATQVGAKRQDLRLVDNRLDVRVDAGAGTAQLEWEFTWENTGRFQAEEARMLLHVPGAGAATRLTLWVAGEPQEAAFGPRAQVRQAYQQVAVQQRRDPALLTTRGPDRLLLQCFPIPMGRTLKARVGLTLPFEPDGAGASLVRLPVVEAANFNVAQEVAVPLWIEGAEGMLLREVGSAVSGALPRSLAWGRLRHGGLALSARGAFTRVGRLSGDEREPGVVVHETTREIPAVEKWVLVVDGSAPSGKRMPELAAALEKLQGRFSLWWAGERTEHLARASGAEAAAWLLARRPVGGQDPAEVLAEAWDEAADLGATLVWMHGSLPLTWKPTGALRQRLDRETDAVALELVAIAPGENLLVAEFDAFAGAVETWSALGTGEVRRVLEQIGSGRKLRDWGLVEQAGEMPERVVQRAEPAVRLWLAQRLASERSRTARAELVKLATRLGVVTAHTGAVVLESATDYERHKLEQQDPQVVPQVPEPAHVALVAGVVVLGYVVLRRTRLGRSPGRGARSSTD